MIRNEEQLLRVADAFHSAALDGKSWNAALEGMAQATGSRCGELIGLGSETAVPFNIVTNMDPEFHADFDATGGGDPRLNPRVKAGIAAPPLTVLAESDFIAEDEYKRHPHYQDFSRRWDIAFTCLTNLERHDNLLIGLAVLRSKREGHITNEQRAAFTAIAPHVRIAVRTQIALEGNGTAVLAGAMEALSIPAFVCDGIGRVKSLTPSAEALVSCGRALQLRLGRLQASMASDTKVLNDAIDAAAVRRAESSGPALRTVILRPEEPGGQPLALDVIALPSRHYEFGFAPRVLVVARGSRGTDARKPAILQAAYSLTSAETAVALQLAEGETAGAIAASRGVALGTIRTQIKAVLAKVGVNRQVELVARLSQLRL